MGTETIIYSFILYFLVPLKSFKPRMGTETSCNAVFQRLFLLKSFKPRMGTET